MFTVVDFKMVSQLDLKCVRFSSNIVLIQINSFNVTDREIKFKCDEIDIEFLYTLPMRFSFWNYFVFLKRKNNKNTQFWGFVYSKGGHFRLFNSCKSIIFSQNAFSFFCPFRKKFWSCFCRSNQKFYCLQFDQLE